MNFLKILSSIVDSGRHKWYRWQRKAGYSGSEDLEVISIPKPFRMSSCQVCWLLSIGGDLAFKKTLREQASNRFPAISSCLDQSQARSLKHQADWRDGMADMMGPENDGEVITTSVPDGGMGTIRVSGTPSQCGWRQMHSIVPSPLWLVPRTSSRRSLKIKDATGGMGTTLEVYWSFFPALLKWGPFFSRSMVLLSPLYPVQAANFCFTEPMNLSGADTRLNMGTKKKKTLTIMDDCAKL